MIGSGVRGIPTPKGKNKNKTIEWVGSDPFRPAMSDILKLGNWRWVATPEIKDGNPTGRCIVSVYDPDGVFYSRHGEEYESFEIDDEVNVGEPKKLKDNKKNLDDVVGSVNVKCKISESLIEVETR